MWHGMNALCTFLWFFADIFAKVVGFCQLPGRSLGNYRHFVAEFKPVSTRLNEKKLRKGLSKDFSCLSL